MPVRTGYPKIHAEARPARFRRRNGSSLFSFGHARVAWGL